MKWILFFLLLVIGTASLGLLYLKDPGLIEILWFGYEIQLTAVLAFLILFSFLFFLILFGWVFSWFLGLPYRWLSLLNRAKKRKAQDVLIDFLTSYEAESFDEALHHQKKVAEELQNNPLFLWISGNTFEKTDQNFEAEKCFVDLTKSPHTIFLGLKGRIRSAMHREDFKTAYDLLKHAFKISPRSPWVLKHFLALLRKQNKFEEIESLILRMEDLGYLTSEQSKQQVAYVQYQKALEPKTSREQKEVFLRQAHFLDPSLAGATEILADILQEQGHITYALNSIEETWPLSPTQKLADIYLKISSPQDDLTRFQEAQNLVKENPKHPESLFLLSRTALQAKLWGETRAFLTDLVKQRQTSDVYQLLARLELEEKQDWKSALQWYEEGLRAPRHIES
jgi:uncharacterized membrane-anchored protein